MRLVHHEPFNFVFVGDGYSSEDLDLSSTHSVKLGHDPRQEPFATYRNYINAHRVTKSVDSGVSQIHHRSLKTRRWA